MNSSPFELFRRNLKPLMVLLTGLALFAFVALPVLDTYMRQSAGATGSDVVATYSGTELTRGRVNYFTQNHNSVVRFLILLGQETISRGGTPQVVGFSFDDQSGQVTQVGINQFPSEMGSIRSLMLASLAQTEGFELDDNALQVWLEQYTNGTMTEKEIIGLLMRETQNRLGRPHLYEQLRTHLLAEVYEKRGVSGLFLGQSPRSGPLLTPEEHWDNFLKLNRSAIVSAYGIKVADYLPETTESPSQIEIEAMYEDGKDRDPNKFSSEPGFHRQYVAKYEYVAGDLQSYIDAEVAKLSEEEIRADYDRRVKGGDFLIPVDVSLPPIEEPAAETEAEGASSSEGETADASAASSSETSGSAPVSEGEPEQTEGSAAEDAGSETDGQTGQQEAAPSTDEQSSAANVEAVRLVSAFQQEASEQQDGEAAQADSPQNPEQADQPADEAVVDNAPSEDSETETVESYESVRDQVAEDMVRDAAQKRMADALTRVESQMQDYFRQHTKYETTVKIKGDEGREPPAKPSLEQLAEELGLIHEVIGPYSVSTITETTASGEFIEPIAGSVSMDSIQMGQSANFVQLAYSPASAESQEPSLGLFTPISTLSPNPGTMRQYLTWKIEQVAAYTPTLEEVKDEVVMAIRLKEARKLAVQAAEAIVSQGKDKESVELKDLIPEDKRDSLKEGLGPFTWMTSLGMSGASIGTVPEIEAAGADFMKVVFTNEAGTISVATDQPGDVVYIIQADSFQPGEEELHEQFKQPMNRFMSMMLGNNAGEIVGGYFEKMDEKTKFKDLTAVE
jgi:hypothetical protein